MRSLLCRLEDLEAAPLQRFDAAGHRIVVVALGAELFALDDTCSHKAAFPAEEGEVDAEGDGIFIEVHEG
jgi:nitrite reductase/ring-hydroxylating ferredoxin subunit